MVSPAPSAHQPTPPETSLYGDHVVRIPEWAVEAAASAPRISAADAGPLIAIFAAARARIPDVALERAA